MRQLTDYHKEIIEYYNSTENAYKDAWDLDKSQAIHYGYSDEHARDFPSSLARMNEIMMNAVSIKSSDDVLDAGCGIGGSSVFLAKRKGCKVTGITLSQKQTEKAKSISVDSGIAHHLNFVVADYCNTPFANASFDVVWACESVCYAHDKEQFIREAFRLLRPGGRLVVADGFVSEFGHNEHPFISQWLKGWKVNYLESPKRFTGFMEQTGFNEVSYRDISKHVLPSAKRLYRFYFLANIYLLGKKITFTDRSTPVQRSNINACRYQYLALRKCLWQYGLTTGTKTY